MTYLEELQDLRGKLLVIRYSYPTALPDSEMLGEKPSNVEVAMSGLLFEIDHLIYALKYMAKAKETS